MGGMSGVPNLSALPSSLDSSPKGELRFNSDKRSRSVDLKCVRRRTPEFQQAGGPGSFQKRPHWTSIETKVKHSLVPKSRFSHIPGLCSHFTVDERAHRGSLRKPTRSFGLVTDKECQTETSVFDKLRNGQPIPPGMRVSPRVPKEPQPGLTEEATARIRERLQKRLKSPTARCFQTWDEQRVSHLRSRIDHLGQPKDLEALHQLQLAVAKRFAAATSPAEATCEMGQLLVGLVQPEHAAVFIGDMNLGLSPVWQSAGIEHQIASITAEQLQTAQSVVQSVSSLGKPVNCADIQNHPEFNLAFDGLGAMHSFTHAKTVAVQVCVL